MLLSVDDEASGQLNVYRAPNVLETKRKSSRQSPARDGFTRHSNERVANSVCGAQKVRTAHWGLLVRRRVVDGVGRMLHNFLARRVLSCRVCCERSQRKSANQQTSRRDSLSGINVSL
jgi:hypothetical protein